MALIYLKVCPTIRNKGKKRRERKYLDIPFFPTNSPWVLRDFNATFLHGLGRLVSLDMTRVVQVGHFVKFSYIYAGRFREYHTFQEPMKTYGT